MKIELTGFATSEAWGIRAVAPNGETATHADVVRLLSLALEYYSRSPGSRVLTEAELAAIAAECALPEGWAATADGVNLMVVGEDRSYSRTYTKNGVTAEAPCAPDGSPIPATRMALLPKTETAEA